MFLSIALAFIDDAEDKDLFVALYEQHFSGMLAYANSILWRGHARFAEDAVQDAFVSIAKNMDTIKKIPPDKRKSFLACVVKNKAIDAMRRNSHTADAPSYDEISPEVEAQTPSPIDKLISDEGYALLKDCIARMSDTYRPVLELRLIHGLSDAEVATLLDLTQKTVSLRYYRGKQKLREMILAEGGAQ